MYFEQTVAFLIHIEFCDNKNNNNHNIAIKFYKNNNS